MMQTSGMCPQFVISSFLLEWLSLSALHQRINKKPILLKNNKKGQFGYSATIHWGRTFIHTFTQEK